MPLYVGVVGLLNCIAFTHAYQAASAVEKPDDQCQSFMFLSNWLCSIAYGHDAVTLAA